MKNENDMPDIYGGVLTRCYSNCKNSENYIVICSFESGFIEFAERTGFTWFLAERYPLGRSLKKTTPPFFCIRCNF